MPNDFAIMIAHENTRRLRTYSRRMINMAFGGLKHPCFYMHVPKCGGTSLSEAIYATVPMHRRVGVIDAIATRTATTIIHNSNSNGQIPYHDDFPNGIEVYKLREQFLITHMAWETELIHGHILFSGIAHEHFGNKYRYITMLRDPIERTLSNYLGSVRGGLIDDNFEQYLQSDTFRTNGLSMLRYFSGNHRIDISEESKAVELAVNNMRLFSIIGFLDDIGSFSEQYSDVFGRRPKLYRYNQAGSNHPKLSSHQRAHIDKVLEPELKLWEIIKKERK